MPDIRTKTSHSVDYLEIKALQDLCFDIAESTGWHDESDKLRLAVTLGEPAAESNLRNYYGNKLMLIVSEAVEAQDELRSGHAMDETYFNDEKPDKPEGVPSELADVVIRAFDLAGESGIDLARAITEKLAFNSTRAHMHGGKKF